MNLQPNCQVRILLQCGPGRDSFEQYIDRLGTGWETETIAGLQAIVHHRWPPYSHGVHQLNFSLRQLSRLRRRAQANVNQ